MDEAGNWADFRQDDDGDGIWDIVQTRSNNPANEITVINSDAGPTWDTPVYNADGNMTVFPQPANPTDVFGAVYDAWNRLMELTGDDEIVATYQYDGMKRRVSSTPYKDGVAGESIHFYYTDNWQVVEERTKGDSGDVYAQFVWGNRYIDDLVLRDRRTTSGSELDERFYVLQDANWNVTAIADSIGNVQERYGYWAYGIPTFLDSAFGSPSTMSSYDWETLFAGYRYDVESGLYQVRNRFYASNLGTWIQRDPLGTSDGVNIYQYAHSNPLCMTDPIGLTPAGALVPPAVVGILLGIGEATLSAALGLLSSLAPMLQSIPVAGQIAGAAVLVGGVGAYFWVRMGLRRCAAPWRQCEVQAAVKAGFCSDIACRPRLFNDLTMKHFCWQRYYFRFRPKCGWLWFLCVLRGGYGSFGDVPTMNCEPNRCTDLCAEDCPEGLDLDDGGQEVAF